MVLCFLVIVRCQSFCVSLTVATVKRFSFMMITGIAALELEKSGVRRAISRCQNAVDKVNVR